MHSIAIICIILSTGLCTCDDTCSSSTCYLDFSCDSCGPTPIDINSDRVQFLSSLPPLVVKSAYNETAFIRNTGVTIQEATVNYTSISTVSGGCLCGNTYRFYIDTYNFINCPDQISGPSIDGNGTMLSIWTLYINVKYETVEDAMDSSDGFVMFITPIYLGAENPDFDYFGSKLQSVRQPGETAEVEAGPYYKWFVKAGQFDDFLYYFYQGSFNFQGVGDGNTCSHCTTVIFFPPSPNISISQSQFENFSTLKNWGNRTMQYQVPVYAQGNRKVFAAYGYNSTDI